MLVIAVSINTYIVSLGFGSHIDTISHDNLKLISLNTILVATFSCLATSLSKASFAVTLYRLTSSRWMRWLLIWIIVSISIFLNLIWIFGLVKCTPFERVIDSSAPGKCWNKQKLFTYQLFASCYSGALDFVLAFLPWPIILGLSLRWRERVGVAIAMSLGVVAGITAIVKTTLITSMKSADFTYERADLTIWTVAEPAASIMAISIPVLRMLYSEIRTSRRGYQREGKGKYASNSETSRSKSSSAWHKPSSRYGRHEAVIISTTDWQDSQEALQSRQNQEGPSHSSTGITKTNQISVRHEQASLDNRHSIELENFDGPGV
ncbi:Integral membrane protein [Fusarium austroafricanum]|uniref:Integral membrane protein n=1 Tax=Fusarium austroafricanum TaxID=2364996 RepID=A0A8H4KAK9_9HYPO|nr:Integral membrane protein [Fusarium austroafricanum]